MAETARPRPTPEQLLKQVEAEERHEKRGKLKIILGYASGVGKSFRMLDEGRRRKTRGQDVVVVATQPSASPEVETLLRGFDTIPLVNGAIDVAAVLRRRPEVVLIDGLAYRNPPGGKNPAALAGCRGIPSRGISVITSINLQYIAEKQQQVEAIRGKTVKDSVPEAFVRTADEIELVDAALSIASPTRSKEGSNPFSMLLNCNGSFQSCDK